MREGQKNVCVLIFQGISTIMVKETGFQVKGEREMTAV